MVRQGVHVYARQGVHHSRRRGLPRARLRQDRLLRGRHRRATLMDSAAHGIDRTGAAAAVAGRNPADPQSARRDQAAGAMRRLRRTKVVATLGPSSSEQAMIARLFAAGADVFRINMSHTPHDKMRAMVTAIRAVEAEQGRPIGILVDLQGPKLRVGAFGDDAVVLKEGETFALDSDATPGNAQRVQLPHPEILTALEPGHTLLLDDGKIRLTAIEAT